MAVLPMHPIHFAFLTTFPADTERFTAVRLFHLLDKMEPTHRDTILGFIFNLFGTPNPDGYRPETCLEEKYAEFKETFRRSVTHCPNAEFKDDTESYAVYGFVCYVLSNALFKPGLSATTVREVLHSDDHNIDAAINEFTTDSPAPWVRVWTLKMLRYLNRWCDRTATLDLAYRLFCEDVVGPLLASSGQQQSDP